MDKVIVRFKRPSGSGRKMPSASLNEAMVSLADSEEMRPLLCEANAEGKALAIDIYQSRSGRPLLVHFSKEAL
ncbi:MAG TPA: hypothetical protein VG844_10835 [Terracidiphilus sp.]|nr:hypothetical protein [Terracidiphilus sp.]